MKDTKLLIIGFVLLFGAIAASWAISANRFNSGEIVLFAVLAAVGGIGAALICSALIKMNGRC